MKVQATDALGCGTKQRGKNDDGCTDAVTNELSTLMFATLVRVACINVMHHSSSPCKPGTNTSTWTRVSTRHPLDRGVCFTSQAKSHVMVRGQFLSSLVPTRWTQIIVDETAPACSDRHRAACVISTSAHPNAAHPETSHPMVALCAASMMMRPPPGRHRNRRNAHRPDKLPISASLIHQGLGPPVRIIQHAHHTFLLLPAPHLRI